MPRGPLTADDCAIIDKALMDLVAVEQQLNKCLACGSPAEPAIQRLKDLQEVCNAIKREHFPDRP